MVLGGCEMTREEYKKMIYDASKQDTGSPKDCIHLLSLHRFIDQIYNDHETAIEILMKANEEEISRHFNECEKYEAQLKAKDEEIKELGEIVQQYLIPSKNYDAIIKAKDEITQDIKEAYALKSIAYDLLLEAIQLKDDEIKRLKEIINTSIEEIEYAIIKPQYAEVYLNNAIRFLKDDK